MPSANKKIQLKQFDHILRIPVIIDFIFYASIAI